MADFQFVTDRLATGASIFTPDDAAQVKAAGITAVLNVGDETDEPAFYASLGITYLANLEPDDGNPLTHGSAWFGTSLAFGLPVFAQPHARLFVHCNAGINRGPSTAFAVLLALGFVNAEALIRTVRPQAGLAYMAEATAAVASLGFV